jgi:hypothetical protein
MSRRRYLSTKISLDAKINRLATQYGDFAALLYTWMIPHAEDDGTLPGNPEELLMMVIPGRRDKSADEVADALQAMHDLGLIVWTREGCPVVAFPESFYAYQTYIKEDRRGTAQTRNNAASSAHNGASRDESAQISAKQRTSPQNVASVSVSSSVTFSSPESDTNVSEPSEPQEPEPLRGGADAPVSFEPETDSPLAPEAMEPSGSGTNGRSPPLRPLPPRSPSETEMDYWMRLVKDAANGDRVALLVRLANEKINVSLEDTASYSRIGSLAKKHTASLLVKRIMAASAQHIDGRPLDYLTALCNRSEGGSNGQPNRTGVGKPGAAGAPGANSAGQGSGTPRRYDNWRNRRRNLGGSAEGEHPPTAPT